MSGYTNKACLAIALGILTSIVSASANAALIGHWAGDGNANDSAGSNNGSFINGATTGAGNIGDAFSLDGIDDYISVPDDNAWTFSGDFSLAMWVNFDTLVVAPYFVLMGHDDGPGFTNKWMWRYDPNTSSIEFHLNDAGPVNNTSVNSPTAFAATAGQWHHFGLVRSGSTYTFYADGTSLGSVVETGAIFNASAPLTIGQAEGIGFINGSIDEVRIYDSAEQASHFAALASIPEPASLALLGLGGLLLMGRCRKNHV